ncbi:MAG TPA: hypothetical protein VHH73_16395, partial [Verrucomicrobiae bacterium]|nr:hypothetical protein [Verrucomicrobiae bacterium]
MTSKRIAPEIRGVTRRAFLASAGAGIGMLAWGQPPSAASAKPAFVQRGYYMTFMRMPTYGLPQWKRILEGIRADGGNLLILWMAGGFRSKKFPITWKFNQEHENVRRDFARNLIVYAHTLGIQVILGFTPFGYDGVNQYPIEHPELKAVKADGQTTDPFGIYCWGWNLCPSRPESQRFMREYVREMCFEFYPEADGLMIESSDYAICHCAGCRGKFFEREFEFVETISREVWSRNSNAVVAVYPHYFSGSQVPGFDVLAATKAFDPRWTLVFTPHSAHFDAQLIRRARASLSSDDGPSRRAPEEVQRGAQRARDAGVTGYVPSLEPFSFVPAHAEEGQSYLIGKRQKPFGFGWLKSTENPFHELPLRVNRIAFREFSRRPDLPFDEFKRRLGEDIFGRDWKSQDVDDALFIQRAFFRERTWCQAAPVVSPERLRAMKERGEL